MAAPTDDELLAYLFAGQRHGLAAALAGWVAGSRRFKEFAWANRDKIRKKIRTCTDAAGRDDILLELAAACRLLDERQFAITYEPLAAGAGRNPDFLVLFKTNVPFYVEVKRLREPLAAPTPSSAGTLSPTAPTSPTRLAAAVADKLAQLPPQAMNVLLVGVPTSDLADPATTMRALLERANRKEEAFFTSRGFANARDFLQQLRRLSALLIVAAGGSGPAHLWPNPSAARPLPPDLRNILLRWGDPT